MALSNLLQIAVCYVSHVLIFRFWQAQIILRNGEWSFLDFRCISPLTGLHFSWTNYGGVSAKAEYRHEAALRILLNTLSTSAGRYGRFITPLLSLSIDFYIRCFVRIDSSLERVKRGASSTMIVYLCSQCETTFTQAMGRRDTDNNGNVKYGFPQGPPTDSKCPQCGGRLHVSSKSMKD